MCVVPIISGLAVLIAVVVATLVMVPVTVIVAVITVIMFIMPVRVAVALRQGIARNKNRCREHKRVNPFDRFHEISIGEPPRSTLNILAQLWPANVPIGQCLNAKRKRRSKWSAFNFETFKPY